MMAVNAINLPVGQAKILAGNRLFGLLAIFGAPMLLLQFLFGGENSNPANGSPAIALLGVFYIGGWICGAIGMFRNKIYGETKASRIVFVAQMIFLILALMFSIQESIGVSYENGGGLFFGICDAGYPLSHLFMIVVGIFVLRSKVWTGWTRFAPFLVGAALPLTLTLVPFFGKGVGVFSFAGLTTLGLGTIGYSVYSARRQV
jgi:hypothetical protein